MAAADSVLITVSGVGGHAAMPHHTIDPVAVAVEIYNAVQMIITRNVDPTKTAVISITQFHAGTAGNVIPESAAMNASVRTTDAETRDLIERRIRAICEGIAKSHGIDVKLEYRRGYPATVNHPAEATRLADAAAAVVGENMVDRNCELLMGSEDFSFMLEAKPGAYILLGGGDESHCHPVHHPEFDFNDETLTTGASLWARLVEQELPRQS
jgi:hippurate hydrolase